MSQTGGVSPDISLRAFPAGYRPLPIATSPAQFHNGSYRFPRRIMAVFQVIPAAGRDDSVRWFTKEERRFAIGIVLISYVAA